MQRKPSIIVEEHDPQLGMLFVEVLAEAGYAVQLWPEGAGAYDFIRQQQPDLVILDVWVRRRGGGWWVLHALQQEPLTREIPVIVCTAERASPPVDGPYATGWPGATLSMPFELDALLRLVAEGLSPIAKRADQRRTGAEHLALAGAG